MTWLVRARLAASAGLLTATGIFGAASAGPAVAAEGCNGVLVVVEGRQVGGGTAAHCASNPSDGLAALRQAGFAVTLGTGRYAGGFVCAIDARPDRGCADVDADTYWSYWSMQSGTDRWVYSSVGAASSRPKAGGLEAWVWQDGGAVEQPTARSAIPPNTPPSPDPAAGAGRPASGGSATGGSATGGSATGGSTPAPDGTAAAPTAGTETSAPANSADPTSTPAQAAASEQTVAAAPASADGPAPSGPPAWTGVAGLVVAAIIVADAARRARARRRESR